MHYSLQRQSEASSIGFDWPDAGGVVCKIDEELHEVRDAIANGDLAHARRELGDLLLACVNLARFIGADPSCELIASTDRFAARVEACVALLRERGRAPRECSIAELDAAWASVKKVEQVARQNGA
jgi:ATP diphosphatase